MTRRELKKRMTDAVYMFIIKLVFVYPFKALYYLGLGIWLFIKWLSDVITENRIKREYRKMILGKSIKSNFDNRNL